MEILQVFVAFSEYINFNRQDSNTKQFLEVSLKDSRMKNFYPLPKSKICCDSTYRESIEGTSWSFNIMD